MTNQNYKPQHVHKSVDMWCGLQAPEMRFISCVHWMAGLTCHNWGNECAITIIGTAKNLAIEISMLV